jgi:competence protein ComEC
MKPFGLFLLALGLLASTGPAIASEQSGTALVAFLDVGQGDAILIRSPEGKTALIDAGPSKEVVPLLKELRVNSIDLVAISHHHADHYGGMAEVIETFHPRVFLATDSSHTTPHYVKLLELVRSSGMHAIFPANRPRRIGLGSVMLTVLPQPPEDPHDENDNSLGMRVQYGAFAVLLTGDSQARERAFWEANCPDLIRDCTVLKLAHHGSRNGTDARWLGVVRPQLAVASLGRGNEFGHPHPETLSLLERRGIPLLRTDVDGTVTVVSDGGRWWLPRHPGTVRGPPAADEQPGKRRRETEHPGRRINVNTASQEELESLPGIGPVLAKRIIQGRPYRSVDGLLRVKGIGERRLAELRPLVTAR